MADKRISELDKIITIDHATDEIVIVDKDTATTKRATLDQINHDELQNSGSNSHAQIDAHIADDAKHREIDDLTPSTTSLYSGQKIEDELAGKADTSHTHDASEIVSGTLDNARVSASNVTQHEGVINHDNLAGVDPDEHIDHASVSIQGGEGLSGGGNLTASRTINLSVDSLDAIITADDADLLVVFDASEGIHRKITKQNLLQGLASGGGTLVKVSANDTTAGYLQDKVDNDDGKLDITVDGEGTDETLIINVAEANINHDALANFSVEEHIRWGSPGAEFLDNSRVSASNVTQHQSSINHDALAGFVLDEHVNHSTITMEAGEGLQGGGTIDASRVFELDVNGLPIDPTPNNDVDYVLVYDVSAGAHRKVLINDLASGFIEGGEINTGQNIGVGTGEIFKEKTGSTLDLRTLKSDHDRLSITTDTDEIDFTLDFNQDNVLLVEINPKTGEYGSIEDAITAINLAGDATSTNRYLVQIGMGVFEENELTIPSHTTIIGLSSTATTIKPLGDHTLFNMTFNTRMERFRIDGSPAISSKLIVAEDVVTGLITDVIINGGYTQLHHTTTAPGPDSVLIASDCLFLNCLWEGVTTEGSILANAKVTTRVNNSTIANVFGGITAGHHYIHVGGAKATFVASGITMENVIDPGNGFAVHAINGANCELKSSRLIGFDTAIEVKLGDENVNLSFNSNEFSNNTTWDLNIEDPTTTGYFFGITNYSKINIVKEAAFFIDGQDPNIIVVSKKGGDFTSIAAALAAITDEAIDNSYVIRVGPGIFDEPPLTIRSNISIQGTVGGLTVVRPTDNTQDFITMQASTQIVELEMYGPTDPNTYTLNIDDNSGLYLVRNSSFSDAYGFVRMEVTGASAPFCALVTTISNANVASAVNPFKLSSVSPLAQFVISTADYGFLGNVNLDTFFDVSGAIVCEIRNGQFRNLGTNLGTAIKLSDTGVIAITSSDFENLDRGIDVLNIGDGGRLAVDAKFIDVATSHISVNNPGATGTITGKMDNSKVFIDQASDVSYVGIDNQAGDTGIAIVGDILQGDRKDREIRLSKLIRDTATMGLLQGGALSRSGVLELQITGGNGFLRDLSEDFIKEITWETTTLTVPDNDVVYVYVNDNTILTASESRPASQNILLLGRVITDNGDVLFIEQTALRANHWANSNDEKNREATNAVYVNGSQISENAINDRQLDVSSGIYYFSNNRFAPSGGTSVTMKLVTRDGVGGYTYVDTTTIPNDTYDDGTGTPAAIPAGHYVKYSLYVVGQGADEAYLLVRPQFTDAALVVVEEGNIPTPPGFFDESIALIASIIVQEGVSPINKTFDLRPIAGARAATLSASSDHGELLGLADDDHLQYLNRNGTRAMTADLNMDNNDIVTGTGLVDGVDVSSHQDRHLPNGADPLTTATAVTLNGNSTNTEGNANSLARSNHTHLIEEATGAIAGLMSTSDKTKMDGIEPLAKDDQNAVEVPFNNVDGSLVSTNVKTAIDELDQRTVNIDSDKLDRDGTQAMTGALNMGTFAITNVGTVDGRDVSVDGNTLDNHLDGGAGKHDATEIDYEVLDGQKTDIDAASDNLELAVGDLDDFKLSTQGNNAMEANLDMGGNAITNVGTVDGRDVSVDGTKLDGIEPLAKDDQNAVEVPYNNADSTLIATNVKTGLDELDGKIGAHASNHLPSGSDPLVTAAAVTLGANSTNTEGNAESFARSNHTHDLATGIPITQGPDNANAEGVSNNLARADHVHNIPAATAVNIGDANAEGVSTSFARADHVHNTFPVFENQDASADALTTGSIATAKLTFTPNVVIGRRYKIEYCMEHNATTNNAVSTGTCVVAGTTVGSTSNSNSDNSDSPVSLSGFYYYTAVATGTITITLNISLVGGGTWQAKNARLDIRRVS